MRSELRGRALGTQTINSISVHKRTAIQETSAAGRTRSERPASCALSQQAEHNPKDRQRSDVHSTYSRQRTPKEPPPPPPQSPVRNQREFDLPANSGRL